MRSEFTLARAKQLADATKEHFSRASPSDISDVFKHQKRLLALCIPQSHDSAHLYLKSSSEQFIAMVPKGFIVTGYYQASIDDTHNPGPERYTVAVNLYADLENVMITNSTKVIPLYGR